MEGGRRCYQRVSQLHVMALRILSEVFARPLANFQIDGDTRYRRKQFSQRFLFMRPRPVP